MWPQVTGQVSRPFPGGSVGWQAAWEIAQPAVKVSRASGESLPTQFALESTCTAHDRYEDFDRSHRPGRPTVGVVAESGADERRVALVPKAVSTLVNSGVAVVVESGAGQRALLPDDLYTAAGATIGDAWGCDVVVKVAPPSPAEVARLRSGQTLIGFLAPRNADNQIAALKRPGCRLSPSRRSRGSPGRRPWTRCPHRPTSPATSRCCSRPASPPGSSRC